MVLLAVRGRRLHAPEGDQSTGGAGASATTGDSSSEQDNGLDALATGADLGKTDDEKGGAAEGGVPPKPGENSLPHSGPPGTKPKPSEQLTSPSASGFGSFLPILLILVGALILGSALTSPRPPATPPKGEGDPKAAKPSNL